MRKRGYAFGAVFASVAIVVLAACQGANNGGGGPSGGGGSSLKIGLVTDVGTLDDHNFNQYSWEGAKAGAQAVGAPTPHNIVTTQSADYAKNINSFVSQHYDIIVTVGFALGSDTTKAAKANPNIKFIGVDQGICVDAQGNPDSTFTCKGDAAKLLPNYQGLVFKEQQPGYLAGVVAASISKSGHIAAIGGTATVPAVPNYMIGYLNGAKSVKSDIKVELKYISAAPDAKAFNDPAGGKAAADQLLAQNPDIDVLFQVAGKTGNGVLQSVTEAGIYGIGVDVDQWLSNPESAECTVTSAEKKLTLAVSEGIAAVGDGSPRAGNVFYGADNDGVGLAPYYQFADLIDDETQGLIDDAFAQMASGDLDPCQPSGLCYAGEADRGT
jgi:basic membrane protein A